MPIDRPIRLRFDRPLLPATANRQAISLYTGGPGVGALFLFPDYDVFERALTYRLSGTLEPRALYRIDLPIAAEREMPGLRAFDGAPLAGGAAGTQLSFFTSASLFHGDEAAPFTEPTCADVVELFTQRCASGCCHGGERPAMGLALDSKDALVATAIARVAHQTETGNTAGVTFENPARFGVAMPIIDPASAANSYLVYKLLLSAENLAPCASGDCRFDELPGARSCVPLSAAEREGLATWFVRGEPMPAPRPPGAENDCLPSVRTPLDCGEVRAIARFIDGGAPCK